MGQTVNLLVFTFGGSNPSLPTIKECRLELQTHGDNQMKGRSFESLFFEGGHKNVASVGKGSSV